MTEDRSKEQEQQALAAQQPGPGELVREQREAAGLSFHDVADGLHMTVHYVKALENDDYAKLPGLTFVKGYFRSYARFLGIDEEPVLERYEAFLKSQDLVNNQGQSYRFRKRTDQVIMWAIIAAVILVTGLLLGWWFFGRESATANATAAASNAVRQTESTLRNQETLARSDAARADNSDASTEVDDLLATASSAESHDNNVTADNAAMQSSASLDVESKDIEESRDSVSRVQSTSSADITTDTQVLTSESITDIAASPVAAETDLADAAQPDTAQSTDTSARQASERIAETTHGAVVEAQSAVAGLSDNTGPAFASGALAVGSAAMPVSDAPAAMNNAGTGSNTNISLGSDGSRDVSLLGEGDDLLQLKFSGNSWVEIGDAVDQVLYNDLMQPGDQLNLTSQAPFYVLVGDATKVEVLLNANPMNIRYRIRADKSARFIVSEQGVKRWVIP